jgi:hypothetical protein
MSKLTKKIIITIILIVAIIFFGFVIKYYWQDNSSGNAGKDNLISLVTSTDNKDTSSQVKAVNPNMLIYINQKYGYSIEYPKSWWYAWLGNNDGKKANIYWFVSDKSDMELKDGGFSVGAKVEIIVQDLKEALKLDSRFPDIDSAQDWVDWQRTGYSKLTGKKAVYDDKKITIAGKEAIKTIEDEPQFGDAGPVVEITLYNANKIYQIKYLGRDPAYALNTTLFEKMLKSFKLK